MRTQSRPGLFASATTWTPVRKFLAGKMRKMTAARARAEHYPAPYALIDAFERAGNAWQDMLRLEIDNVPNLLVGDTSTNLRRVFRLMEEIKGQGWHSDFSARWVHFIGACVMGGGIAARTSAPGRDDP